MSMSKWVSLQNEEKNNGSWPQQFWQPSPRTLQSGSRLPRCSKLDPKWVYQTGYHFIITEQKGRVRTSGRTCGQNYVSYPIHQNSAHVFGGIFWSVWNQSGTSPRLRSVQRAYQVIVVQDRALFAAADQSMIEP